MFTIFGGATAFTQWQKDQKVTNPNMTAGDPVYFAASNGESYPTRAYISGGDVVADVPNELLTMHKPFTARLDDHDEPVTIFRVEAADKPSGYVYEDNMNKTHVPGDVVIPAGATLTLEEGAKVNDKAGVLATAGGSESAGGGVYRIVCENGSALGLPDGAFLALEYATDITESEILAAFNSGAHVFVDFINPMENGMTIRLPMIGGGVGMIEFGAVINGVSMVSQFLQDETGTRITLTVYPPAGG